MKKILFAFAIIAVSIAVFAFTQPAQVSKETTLQDVWYSFNGTQGQVTDRTKYSNTYNNTNPGCANDGDVCAIRLPNSGSSLPNQSDFDAIKSTIQNSQNSNTSLHSSIGMQQ